uniref:Uncharacterized protein n=1 Tax=Arundo donax TaxID=35708 RepID=A0A0A9HJV2_ARUDO
MSCVAVHGIEPCHILTAIGRHEATPLSAPLPARRPDQRRRRRPQPLRTPPKSLSLFCSLSRAASNAAAGACSSPLRCQEPAQEVVRELLRRVLRTRTPRSRQKPCAQPSSSAPATWRPRTRPTASSFLRPPRPRSELRRFTRIKY